MRLIFYYQPGTLLYKAQEPQVMAMLMWLLKGQIITQVSSSLQSKIHMPRFCKYKYSFIVKSCVIAGHFCNNYIASTVEPHFTVTW